MASDNSFTPQINISNSSAPAPEPTPESTGEITWLEGRVQSLGEGSDAIFEIDYDLSLFQSLFMNGKELTLNEDYSLEEGSTIIIIKGNYLATLGSGNYNLVAKYSDGKEFSTVLAISENPEELEGSILVPNTGAISAQMFGANLGRNMPFIFSGLLIILVGFFAIRKFLLPRLKAHSYTHSSFRTTTSFKPTQKPINHSLLDSITSIKNHFYTKSISLPKAPKTGLNIKSHKLITITAGIAIIAGGTYLCLNTLTPAANEEVVFAAPTDGNTLSFSTSDGSFVKDVDLANGSIFTSATQTITINDATAHGYKLFISTNSSEYNDLSINGSTTADARILSTSNTFTSPGTLEADSYGFAVANSTFGTNYAPSSTSKWASIPVQGSETTIKETTSATPANDSTTIYYGFNITDNLPDGSYFGTGNSSITYKAIATVLPTYTVNYYCNGGSGNIEAQTADIGTPITIKDITGCERENYTFKNWNIITNNTGTSYSPGSTYTGDQNINLYAIWEYESTDPDQDPSTETYNTFVLSYNANGGSSAPGQQSQTTTAANAAFTISPTKPTRNNYTFKGWCTVATTNSSCAGGTTYEPGKTLTTTAASTTLYAIWEYSGPIAVTNVVNKTGNGTQILVNSSNPKVTLSAEVQPANATNKSLTWTSNNNKVATVNNGVVTGVDAGVATITAKANDGSGKYAQFTVTVRKKVLIILGASQIQRINGYSATNNIYANIKNYTSSKSGNKYVTTKNNQWAKTNSAPKAYGETLNFIYLYGHGFQFETGYNFKLDVAKSSNDTNPPYSGWSFAKSIVNNYTAAQKNYVDFYIYFTLVGNDIKLYSCGDINNNASKTKKIYNDDGELTRTIYLPSISDQVKAYNDNIQALKDNGYKVKGYVTSVQPVKASESSASNIVNSNNAHSCDVGYRSNIKYYKLGIKVQSYIKNYSNLEYVDTLGAILNTSNTTNGWSWNKTWANTWGTYKTDDGVHWNKNFAGKYLNFWMSLNTDL